MYTDRNEKGESDDETQAKRTDGVRSGEEKVHPDINPSSLDDPGRDGYSGWTVSIGFNRENCSWLDSLRSQDSTRGGIASRLLETKLEQLGEVRGRLKIVLSRKAEYESKIAQIEREIEEIREIASEIFQIDEKQEE
jgi:hypothetical protein